jgi:hypothetical protein
MRRTPKQVLGVFEHHLGGLAQQCSVRSVVSCSGRFSAPWRRPSILKERRTNPAAPFEPNDNLDPEQRRFRVVRDVTNRVLLVALTVPHVVQIARSARRRPATSSRQNITRSERQFWASARRAVADRVLQSS